MLVVHSIKISFYILSFSLLIDVNHSKETNGDSRICNKGTKQSPVDISIENVIRKNNDNRSLRLINYNKRANRLKMQKHGYHVELSGTWNGVKPVISGSVLSNQNYVFYDVHIHWSEQDDTGSEHSFDGKRYAAELHSVHVNEKYANFTEALDYPDGLAVIGILFKVNDNASHNSGMKNFASLGQMSGSNKSASADDSFDFSLFLPKTSLSFFHYNGSLTTPPCTENVRWIIFSSPQPISSATMKLLRNTSSEVIESESVRPLQRLNGRTIDFYDKN